MRVSFAPEKVLSFSFCFSSVCVFDIFCAGQKTAARPPPLLQIQQWYQSVDFVRLCVATSIYISAFSPSAHAIFQDLDRGNIYYTFPS